MTAIAQELDARLRALDPQTAAHIEKLVREALTLVEEPPAGGDDGCAAGSSVTIALPDTLDAALTQCAKASGARSKEEYLVSLVEEDCAGQELARVLAERADGPFTPLEADWKDRVRALAAARALA